VELATPDSAWSERLRT